MSHTQKSRDSADRDSHDSTATAPDSVEDGAAVGPGSDLDPEESADVFETREEARRIKQGRDDRRDDEDLISLDSPD